MAGALNASGSTDMMEKWEKARTKAQPWLDFNRRGQLLILLPITFIVLFIRFVVFLLSAFDPLIDEGGVLVLNLVAFVLVFFWVIRIVFPEIRTEIKIPMNSKERKNFIILSSICFLAMNFSLEVDSIPVPPFTILCAGFFIILWLVFLIMDKAILRETFVRFYFMYLTVIIVMVGLIDLAFYFLI